MSNKALCSFALQARRNRPPLPSTYRTNYRIERVNNGYFCDLWFLTAGCTHDANGGCVMCNYGGGCPASVAEREMDCIIAELENIIDGFPYPFEDFILTPSGSMLDQREVTPFMRERLVPVLRSIRTKRFIVETRPETVTEENLRFLEEATPGAMKYVEIGLENGFDWVLEHCINKGTTFGAFCAAIEIAHAHNIYVTANVGIGIPFMSERASIETAVRTVRRVLDAGADSVVLFPYHVKKHTLLDVMSQAGIYCCVSLWALIEVLAELHNDAERIQISWYKDYYGQDKSHIISSPGTCPQCLRDVTSLLDIYRNSPNSSSIELLQNYDCVCHKKWHSALEKQPSGVDIGRVENDYRHLATLLPVSETLLEKEITRMRREYEEWKMW